MILWQEGVFLGSALSSLSPPLHFPGEGDFGHFFTGPVELSLSLLYVKYNDVGRLLKQLTLSEANLFFQDRQAVTAAMVVSAMKGRVIFFKAVKVYQTNNNFDL